MPKNGKPILRTTQNQPGTQPAKTDTTHQNHRQPKRTPKKIEADFSGWTKPTRTYASGESAAKRK